MKKRDQKQLLKINEKVKVSENTNSSNSPKLLRKSPNLNVPETQRFNSQSFIGSKSPQHQNKRRSANSMNGLESTPQKASHSHRQLQKYSKKEIEFQESDDEGNIVQRKSSKSHEQKLVSKSQPDLPESTVSLRKNKTPIQDQKEEDENHQNKDAEKTVDANGKPDNETTKNEGESSESQNPSNAHKQQINEVESEILKTQLKFELIMKEETKTQLKTLKKYSNATYQEKTNTKEKFDNDADFLSFDDIKKGTKTEKNSVQSKFDRAQYYPWLSDKTMEFSSKDMHIYLHNEILDFVQWIQPSIDKKEQRENLVKHIKKVVKKEYPEAVVMVFGSCATGLNLPSSDIDLLVYNPSVSDQQMMNKLANSLLAEGICKSIEALKYAKVPLIKLQDKESNINVDISFNRTNGIYCVKLVKYLQKKYPELRPMILVLKAFLKSRQLNETYHGGVGSFLLTMLVTSYLQKRYKTNGTDKIDLGKHLIDFFHLYGVIFNYDQVGISIRKDGCYFQKIRRGWYSVDDRNRTKLCVENPQDKDIDIGKPAFNIMKVKRAFNHAYDTLVYNNQDEQSLLKLIITTDLLEMKEAE